MKRLTIKDMRSIDSLSDEQANAVYKYGWHMKADGIILGGLTSVVCIGCIVGAIEFWNFYKQYRKI